MFLMQAATSRMELALIEKGFQALSEGLRLKILDLLGSHELCVCEISEKLNISQSKLSFHLKKLKDAQLVYARQEGRWSYYRLNMAQILKLEEYLAEYRRKTPVIPPRLCED